MEFYRSVNGFKVLKAKPLKYKVLHKNVLDFFTDSISLNTFQNPIYIHQSEQIYDNISAVNWFSESDKDANTRIDVPLHNFQPIIVYNYFLFLLCLEETEFHLYYHPPYGSMDQLLNIARLICNSTIKKNHSYYSNSEDFVLNYEFCYDNLSEDYISLSLEHYIPNLKNIFKPNGEVHPFCIINCDGFKNVYSKYSTNFKIININDILFKCSKTGKNMYGKCYINPDGIFSICGKYKIHNDHLFEYFKFVNARKSKLITNDIKFSVERAFTAKIRSESHMLKWGSLEETFSVGKTIKTNPKLRIRLTNLAVKNCYDLNVIRNNIKYPSFMFEPHVGYEDWSFLEFKNVAFEFNKHKLFAAFTIFKNVSFKKCKIFNLIFIGCIFINCEWGNLIETTTVYKCEGIDNNF